MQWLLHGNITPAAGEALVRHEHKVHQLDEAGLTTASALAEVINAAHSRQWDLLTDDAQLCSELLEGARRFGRSAVYLQLDGQDVEQDDAIDRLFARYKRLTIQRLYTVTASRVKVRQLPTRPRD